MFIDKLVILTYKNAIYQSKLKLLAILMYKLRHNRIVFEELPGSIGDLTVAVLLEETLK
jgi:5,10-methylene-tetrahydrofolate dehydrogenase/methenyl tetrahydrofolate cyclohydrolase